jgi:heptosyltransferase-2
MSFFTTPPPEPKSVVRIVVRLTNWVGDCVMNTPFLNAARRLFPNAHITVLGRKHVADLLRHHESVNDVHAIDDQTKAGRKAAVELVRSLQADLGFALPNSLNSALLLWRGGVRHRVGYNRDARGLLLNHAVPLRPRDLAVHEVRYYLRLLSVWPEAQGLLQETPRISLHVTNEEIAEMHGWLLERGWVEGQPILGVNPAAFYGTAKRWLPERFGESARLLAERHGAKVFVTGIPREREWADRVIAHGSAGFHNAAGEMNLRQLMAFFKYCNLFLTNDSGAMHVAAAMDCPQVAIFGSTDWLTTAPGNPRSLILRKETPCAPCLLRDCPIDHRCMKAVTVEDVVEAGERLIFSPE